MLSAKVEEVEASDWRSRKAVTTAKSSSSQSSTLCKMGRRWANTCREPTSSSRESSVTTSNFNGQRTGVAWWS